MLQQTEKPSRQIAHRNKRAIASILVSLLAVIGLFVAFPHFIEKSSLRDKALAELGNSLGTPLNADRLSQIRTLPGAQFSLFNVQSSDPSSALTIKAGKVTGDFSRFALLAGNIKINSVAISDADIVWDARKRTSTLRPLETALKQVITAVSAGTHAEIKVAACSRCSIRYIGSDGSALEFAGVNARWAWAGGAIPALLGGDMVWRGTELTFQSALSDPLAFVNGSASPLTLDIKSKLATMGFSGKADLSSNLHADGDFNFSAPSFSDFLDWTKPGETAGSKIEALDLSAGITLNDSRLQLADLSLSVSGSQAKGTFDVDLSRQVPKTGGSLAFDSLDLAFLLDALPIGSESGTGIQALDQIDLDLRLSADKAMLGNLEFANAAGAIRIQDGVADLDLGTADIAAGTVQGRLSIEGPSGERKGTLSVNARDIRLASVSGPENGKPAVDAPVSAELHFAGPYSGFHHFLADNGGKLSIDIGKGVLRNFNIGGFSDLVASGASFELSGSYAGMCEIENGTIAARVHNGLLLIDRGQLVLGGKTMELAGILPLSSHGIALNGNLWSDSGARADFFLGGTWEGPVVTTRPTR